MLAKKLESLPSLSSECSIYRVPKRLRKWNDDAYTPQVVSIGPLHHGSNGMQAMEEHKLRYLKDFLLRTQMKFDDYAKFFRMREEKIRNHYEETIKLKSHEFLELIMVDTAFVIEDNYISNYFFVLDRLIDNNDDVELLVENGIIDSKLPDKDAVARFSNNLVQGIGIVNKDFYFTDLFENLNHYCSVGWNKWKANLIQQYFGSPWSIISLIAASIALILTAIQTVYSII
uniref:Uncharacterized protein n=1 Tax=Fagus sylvatica TaxID=28930 RepID=A0A2N9IH63_FAGSY